MLAVRVFFKVNWGHGTANYALLNDWAATEAAAPQVLFFEFPSPAHQLRWVSRAPFKKLQPGLWKATRCGTFTAGAALPACLPVAPRGYLVDAASSGILFQRLRHGNLSTYGPAQWSCEWLTKSLQHFTMPTYPKRWPWMQKPFSIICGCVMDCHFALFWAGRGGGWGVGWSLTLPCRTGSVLLQMYGKCTFSCVSPCTSWYAPASYGDCTPRPPLHSVHLWRELTSRPYSTLDSYWKL